MKPKTVLLLMLTPFVCVLFMVIGRKITEGWIAVIQAKNAAKIEALGSEISNLNDRLQKAMELLTLTGKASWYGDFEHGWPTANNEKFDKYALTAAAVDLPFNSVWQVRRLDTGHSVEVRINDRLPARHGRILDLSWAAARVLDMERKGVVGVVMIPKLGTGD